VIVTATFSYSRLRRYEDCPRSYYLHYVKDLRDEPTEPLLFGTLIHAALERVYGWIVAEEYAGPFPHPQLYRFYQQEFERSALTGAALFDEGRDMLAQYVSRHTEVDHLAILGVEQEFRIPFGRLQLHGFIDRVDRVDAETVRIVDYKTNRLLFSKDEVEHDLQLSLYALVAGQLYPWAKKVQLAFEMLRHDLVLAAERTDERLASARAYALALAERALHDEVFTPRLGPNCAMCGHRQDCEAYQQVLSGGRAPPALLTGDIRDIVEQRQLVAQMAKILYARQKEMDDVIKTHIEAQGPIEADGVRLSLSRFAAQTDYDRAVVGILRDAASASDLDARDRLLVVDKAEVEQWLRELKKTLPPEEHLLLTMRVDAFAERRYSQRLDVRKDRGH